MKSRHLVMAIAALGIGFMHYILLLQPAYEKKAELTRKQQEASELMADFKNTMLTAPEYFRMHRDILDRKESVNSKLFSKEDLIRLFDNLEIRASRYGLKVTEITPSINELLRLNRSFPSGNEPQILNMSIMLKGDFISAGKLIREIENEKFFNGPVLCRISNRSDDRTDSDILFSFKAILGTIRKG